MGIKQPSSATSKNIKSKSQGQNLSQPQPQPHEVLTGIIERITFHNPENGFCVVRVKAKGHRDLITVVGHASIISAGEYLQATGLWIHDNKHGQQFKANFMRVAAPTTIEGIERYLGSGLIKGIGPVYAKKLVTAFAEKIFTIIEETPEALRQIEGIGPMRAAMITKGWADQKVIREIMLFLHNHGISTLRAVRIYKTYGIDAIETISTNPYQLAKDIRGIGFLSADTIAQRLGIDAQSVIRARAGILHVLLEAMADSSCGMPKEELLKDTQTLLEINAAILQQALAELMAEAEVVLDQAEGKECIFLASLYNTEKYLAERLTELTQGVTPWPTIDIDKAQAWLKEQKAINLGSSQEAALRLVLKSKVAVITGGPGVGKTTILKTILTILGARHINIKILLCAPTGRAAKRLSESTGLLAKTIHRLLEVNPATGKFTYNEENKLACDLLVIDEMSMVDILLMSSLLKALPTNAALLLVGDQDQLPSIGPGQVLADIINSNRIPTAKLTEIFRQAQASLIVKYAHMVNQGIIPVFEKHSRLISAGAEIGIKVKARDANLLDCYFIKVEEPIDCVDKIIELVQRRIPSKFNISPSDIQVLCPMQRGSTGARSLSIELQKALNPKRAEQIERFGYSYAVGDKVMQTENDYEKEVYNGDIGIVTNIDAEAQEATISIDNREVTYDFGELDQVIPANAITIHKSQGSEYPAIVIPITMQHYPMLKRQLLYTGMTRGKQLVILIGSRKALAIAVQGKHQQNKRWSKLKERLLVMINDPIISSYY